MVGGYRLKQRENDDRLGRPGRAGVNESIDGEFTGR